MLHTPHRCVPNMQRYMSLDSHVQCTYKAQDRGWYLSYEDMPGAIVTEGEQLADAVAGTLGKDVYAEKRHAFREQYMSCCDGNATKRLIRYILHEETKRNDVEKLV